MQRIAVSMLLIMTAGSTTAAAQSSNEVLVEHRFFNHEINSVIDGVPWIHVRGVIEVSRVPGASGYRGDGWYLSGPKNNIFIIEPVAGTPPLPEIPPKGQFTEATVAAPGKLVVQFTAGNAPANDPVKVAEVRGRLEERYRAFSYDWKVYAVKGYDLEYYFTEKTAAVGDTVDVDLVVRNVRGSYSVGLFDVMPTGPLTMSSEDGGELSFLSGPDPGKIDDLTYSGGVLTGSRDTLRYKYKAKKAGSIILDASVTGVLREDGYSDTTVSGSSICGELIIGDCIIQIDSGFVVNTDGDDSDADIGDGVCDIDLVTANLQCTLRAVIEETNATAGPDDVAFELEGDGPFVISPNSPLPPITEALVLDGFTQDESSPVPIVRIDGAGAGPEADGLTIDGDDVTIRGFMITSFTANGIHFMGGMNGTLEGLIIGSDAEGSEGLGNGGDGIHVTGGEGLTIGGQDPPLGKSGINFPQVHVLANLGNGLYVRNAANEAYFEARRNGKTGGSALGMQLSVHGLVVGMVDALGLPKAIPNLLNGICLRGVQDATFDNVKISDTGMHAIEITSSQLIAFRKMLIGIRVRNALQAGHIGRILGSGFFIRNSGFITVGSGEEGSDPVEGGATDGWFMDVEESDHVEARNLFAGLMANMESVPSPLWEMMRNKSGGMRLVNSPSATIGMLGMPTVFANNGGNTETPQAGIMASGSGSTLLRILNTHLGTTPKGLLGLGNMGSGLLIDNGVTGANVGGDSAEEQVVSGGNGGYGFHFRDLQDPPSKDGSIILPNINGARLVSGFLAAQGKALAKIPNMKGGMCLQRVQNLFLQKLSMGPSMGHALEVLHSSRLTLPSMTVGAMHGMPIQSIDDIAGPDGNALHIVESSEMTIGEILDGISNIEFMPVMLLNAKGRGASIHKSNGIKMQGVGAGGSAGFHLSGQALLAALGNDLEGAVVDSSQNVEISHSTFLGNGEQSTSGIGGLLASNSSDMNLRNNLFGLMNLAKNPHRQNKGSAMGMRRAARLNLIKNRIMGHSTGMLSELSSVTMQQNIFNKQGHTDGIGHAIEMIGGSILASGNTVSEAKGIGVLLKDVTEGLIRLNNIILNNLGGVKAENSTGKGAATILAPDNWWGDASGPGGFGPGMGDTISDGVEALTWLASPQGVTVSPDEYLVEAEPLSEVIVSVEFASPMIGDDALDVVVMDEQGWVTSSTAFQADVLANDPAVYALAVAVGESGADKITIQATSQSDNTLMGEATVIISPPEAIVEMNTPAEAGGTILDVSDQGKFLIGSEVLINPGGVNEEVGVVSGFGSIILAAPLQFRHEAGELLSPANALSVENEDEPHTTVPSAWEMDVFPNPSTTAATLTLSIPHTEPLRTEIFDILGRSVMVLRDETTETGFHSYQVDVSSLASGLYLIKSSTPSTVLTKRFTVIR